MYSVLYSLPPDHYLTRCVRGTKNKENFDIAIEAPMTSMIYKSEAENRPHRIFMEAVLDEAHGSFSLVLSVKPHFRLRDIFAAKGGVQQVIAAGLPLDRARNALAAFETRCSQENLPVAEAPSNLASHHSFAKELRHHKPVTIPSYPTARALLDKLKPF